MALTVSYCCCGCSLRAGTKIIAVYLLVSSICACKLSVATLYTVIWHRDQPLLADLLFFELGRWHWGRNVGWGCLRIGIWGEYLSLSGKWRKLHNEEFNDLYSSPNILHVIKSGRMRRAGHVARMGEGRGVWRVLLGKSEGKRSLERPRHRWEDNIKMDLREVGCGCMDWIELAQDSDSWRTLVNVVMNHRIP